MSEEISKRIERLENTVIQQESRITKILVNLKEYGFQQEDKDRAISSWKALIGYFLRRQTITLVIAFSSGLIALGSFMLAYQANRLVGEQNKLLDYQNKKIVQQTYLQEAERRSSLSFLLGNIMENIDREIVKNEENLGKRILSPQTIGQIIGLSTRLKPYRYLNPETDSLTKILSPERAQLLVFLIESKLDTNTYNQIFDKADFSYAEISNDNLRGYYLKGINLANADLSYSDLAGANMSNADLSFADLSEVKFDLANVRHADFSAADLSFSTLGKAINKSDAIFSDGADLSYIDFSSSSLVNCNFLDVDLSNSDFREADLTSVSFINSDIEYCRFDKSILVETRFNDSEISCSNFREAIFRNVDWSRVILDSIFIDSDNWLDTVSIKNVEYWKKDFEIFEFSSYELPSLPGLLMIEDSNVVAEKGLDTELEERISDYQRHGHRGKRITWQESYFLLRRK